MNIRDLANQCINHAWSEECDDTSRRPKCRYFDTPATLFQFIAPGFVQRVLAGQYDDPKPAARGKRGAAVDEPPPAKGWVG